MESILKTGIGFYSCAVCNSEAYVWYEKKTVSLTPKSLQC